MKKLLIAFIILILAGGTAFLMLNYVLPSTPAANIKTDTDTDTDAKTEAVNTGTSNMEISIESLTDKSFETMNPLEFLQYLEKKTGSVSFFTTPDGWIRPEHIDELIKLADSKKTCAAVISPLSSFLPPEGSTVGNEAMFLIDGYKSGRYPSATTSVNGTSNRNPEEYKKWWTEEGIKKQAMYQARQSCDVLYLAPVENPQLPAGEPTQEAKIYKVHTQKDLEEFTEGLQRRYTIWIDKTSASLINKDWLRKKTMEERIPVILIGCSNTLYAFRDLLQLNPDMNGPKLSEKEKKAEGFSAYRFLDEITTENSNTVNSIKRGFPGKPVLKDILNISAKINDGRQPLKYSESFTPEQKVQYYYWQLRSEPKDKEAENALISLLPQISWNVLFNANMDDLFDILTWFREQSLKENGDNALASLMKSHIGLDGAFAEGYYSSLAEILKNDTQRFIKILSSLDQNVIDDLCQELSYDETAYRNEIVEKLKSMNQGALSPIEKEIVQKLLSSH